MHTQGKGVVSGEDSFFVGTHFVFVHVHSRKVGLKHTGVEGASG